MPTKFFDSIIMLRFGNAKWPKVKYSGVKKQKKFEMFMLILYLSQTKNNSKYLIGYLDVVLRPLVSILPKVSGYVKTFKDKDGDKKWK